MSAPSYPSLTPHDPPKHRTFRDNIYKRVLQRFSDQRREAILALEHAKQALRGSGMPAMEATIDGIDLAILGIEQQEPPPPVWEMAIGLDGHGYVQEERKINGEVAETKHGGHYYLTVQPGVRSGFMLEVQGPAGRVKYDPACGYSESQAFVRAGGYRHTMRRFFGLEALEGTSKRAYTQTPGSEAPPPNPAIPVYPTRGGPEPVEPPPPPPPPPAAP